MITMRVGAVRRKAPHVLDARGSILHLRKALSNISLELNHNQDVPTMTKYLLAYLLDLVQHLM